MRAVVAVAAFLAAVAAVPPAAAQAPCTLQLGGQAVPFAQCGPMGDSEWLYWNTTGQAVTWGLSTTTSSGYGA